MSKSFYVIIMHLVVEVFQYNYFLAILCLLKIRGTGLWTLTQNKALSNTWLWHKFLVFKFTLCGPPLVPFCHLSLHSFCAINLLGYNHILVGHGVVLLFCWSSARSMRFLLYFLCYSLDIDSIQAYSQYLDAMYIIECTIQRTLL